MKTQIKLLAVLAVFALALVPLALVAESSDAEITYSEDVKVTQGFDNMSAGRLTVEYENTGSEELTLKIVVTDKMSKKVLAETEAKIAAGSEDSAATQKVDISFQIGVAGTYNIEVSTTATDPSGNVVDFTAGSKTSTILLEVSLSAWSKWTTYVIIIIVVIAIGVAVWFKIRSAPKSESTTTFTELEERKNEASAPAVSSSKREYKGKKKQ